MREISYGLAGQAAYTAATTVTTGGTDILSISDGGLTRKSQLTVFVKCDLTSATNVKLRVLYSPDGGTTYIAIPIINEVTGVAGDTPIIIDNTSYLISGSTYGAVLDVPISGCTNIKIKGTATSASSTVTMWAFVRDN